MFILLRHIGIGKYLKIPTTTREGDLEILGLSGLAEVPNVAPKKKSVPVTGEFGDFSNW